MIRLDATTRKLQIVLGGAVTTNELPVSVSYSDKTTSAYAGAMQLANTSGATPVDICAAPAASTIRDVDYISVRNSDTVAAAVTIRYNDNATLYTIVTATLDVGDQLVYTHGNGWHVVDSVGKTKVTSSTLTLTASNITNVPAGGIAATDVQTALNELDTEKAPKASPSFTGTIISTVADAVTGLKVAAATNLIRFRPYVDATNGSVIEATDAAESAYAVLTLNGSSLRLLSGGVERINISAAGLITVGSSGVLALQAGAAATPSLTPTGDANTGMWFPAADTIAWSTAGVERMRIEGSVVSIQSAINVVGYGGFYNSANKFGMDIYLGATRMYASGVDASTSGTFEFHTTSSDGVLDTIRLTISSSAVTLGTVLALQAGAAATPSLTPTGDANTGMWFPAADTIAWSTGGTERVRIDSAGKVTIQTLTVGLGSGAAAANTVVGYQALYNSTSSNYGVASGYQALYSATTGNDNVAVGYVALFNNTTGNANTAVGSLAGYSGAALLQTNTFSTYLGYYARANADAYTNSTALGANAIITASNQIMLGDTAITKIVTTGVWAGPAGSVSAPAVSTSGDANTGMWFPAADTIAWSTGGTEWVRIGSAGQVGIGSSGTASITLRVDRNLSGGTIAYGMYSGGVVQSDVTSQARYFDTGVATAAAAFTLSSLFHYRAAKDTFGAGSSVTSQYGFFVASTVTGATNNYGFYGDLVAATGVYNLYMGGTAANYMAGALTVGGALSATSPTAGLGYGAGAGGTVTQLTDKSTGVTLNKVCGYITMNGAALAGDTTVSFTLTNSAIESTDRLIVQHAGTGTIGAYNIAATCAAGSATIYVRNITTGSLSEAIVLGFALIKAVIS